MKILSIDQARNGAWAVFDYETKKLETYGTFSFGNKDYTYARAILAIESLVDTIIKTYNISAVFIEDIQLRVNVQSFKKLAQLQGVLINLFEKNEYLYDFIAPTQWQLFLFLRAVEHTVHGVCRSLLCRVVEMCIDVCRGGEGAVTQPDLDLLHGDTVAEKQAGAGVTKIMEANLAKPVLLDEPREMLRYIVRA